MKEVYVKVLANTFVALLSTLGGWMVRSVWKMHGDIMVAEERLGICLPRWATKCFGWLMLPMRVKRIERKLGYKERGGWILVRTRRVNKCFAEIRKNGFDNNGK